MKKIIIVLMIFFASCSYKDYIVLTDDYKAGIYNHDKTLFSFFKFYRIYKPAKGLAAFPDGGSPKILFQGVIVYLYNTSTNSLSTIHSFDGLKGLRSTWRDWMYFDQENNLYFNISPLSHYSFQKKMNVQNSGIYKFSLKKATHHKITSSAETPQMSSDGKYIVYANFDSIQAQIYIVDKKTEQTKFLDYGFEPKFSPDGNYLSYIYESDSAYYDIKMMELANEKTFKITTIKNINKFSVFWFNEQTLCFEDKKGTKKKYNIDSKVISDNENIKSIKNPNIIPINEIKRFTEHITYPEWGIDIQKFCKQSKNETIETIKNPKKGNENYRLAVLQSISNELTREDIKNLKQLINEHKNSLQGSEKSVYETKSSKIIEFLNKLSETKH